MENKYIPNQVDLFIYSLVTMQPVVYTKAIHVHFTKKTPPPSITTTMDTFMQILPVTLNQGPEHKVNVACV